MPETPQRAACRNALEQFAVRRISSADAQSVLIASGIADDPDGSGTAFSAQQAVLNITQGASVGDVLTSLGV